MSSASEVGEALRSIIDAIPGLYGTVRVINPFGL
jgi:hypothetical protein